MALNLKSLPGNGGWFKPAEHNEDVAILVEVKALERARPTNHGPKDSAVCNITYFATQVDLDSGKPSDVAQGQRVEQNALARDLFTLGEGAATIATVTQVPSTRGLNPSWVWRAAPRAAQEKVLAYAEARDEALEKELEDVPDFGDDD